MVINLEITQIKPSRCVKYYLQEHGSLLRGKVTGENVPQPKNDSVAAMETSIVHSVLPGRDRKSHALF